MASNKRTQTGVSVHLHAEAAMNAVSVLREFLLANRDDCLAATMAGRAGV
jgi:hypothetical protein